MLGTGIVSVTFRQSAPSEIIAAAAAAGLDGVEWGGDIHVPHGDLQTAAEVRKLTIAAGLKNIAYGSYYRLGESEAEGLSFAVVMETAVTLETDTVRVWAGGRSSADAGNSYRQRIYDDAGRIADMAAARGINISFEFHRGTLTDCNASALALMRQLRDYRNIFTYWQPALDMTPDERLDGLQRLLPIVSNIHVFNWRFKDGVVQRLPLADGSVEWRRYLNALAGSTRKHYLLLEFVRNDSVEQFKRDAATLKSWLRGGMYKN